MSRAAVPHMTKARYGRIVSISSHAGRQGAQKGGLHYASAKAGILGFTRTLARQVGPDGITVNAVAPGVVDTRLTRTVLTDDFRESLRQGLPVRKLGEPLPVYAVTNIAPRSRNVGPRSR